MSLKNLQFQKVIVTTTARLHMGFIDLNGSKGRLFGSLGVALNSPTTQIEISKSKKTVIEAKNQLNVVKIVEKFAKTLNLESDFSVKIHQNIPTHAGLGSGTQMALAIGAGLNVLFDLNLSATELATITNRGARSGVGIGTFEQGGLVVDGGRNLNSNQLPPIIARHTFPEDWPILLILDDADQGVFGDEELQAFETLPKAGLINAQQLSHAVLMQALPAIVERDYAQFCQAIHTLQLATGQYFSAAQGGHYKSATVASVLNYLDNEGVMGKGQSSWGPTGFAIFDSVASADNMLVQLKQQFSASQNSGFENLRFQMVYAKNTGASIELIDVPEQH